MRALLLVEVPAAKRATLVVSIAINWYEVEGDYPFYDLSLEPVGAINVVRLSKKQNPVISCQRC